MAKLTIEQALRHGVEAHKLGQFQKADRLYTAILKVQPNHPDANHNMGVLAVGADKNEIALTFFRTALEANSSIAQFWHSYIDVLIKLKKLFDAKVVLDQAKSKDAKGNGFHQLEQRLNEAFKDQNKTNNTGPEKHRNQSIKLDTLSLDQALSLAKEKIHEGYPEKAKQIYRGILQKFPGNKNASDGLVELSGGSISKVSKVQDPSQDLQGTIVNLYSQGQLQQALNQTNILLQEYPSSSVLYNICGAIYQGLGQLDASVNAYKKALAFNPDYVDAYFNMGIALQGQGKLKQAIKAYNKALSIKHDNAEAYNNMGNALKELGKLNKAIASYNKAISIKPDYADAYYNAGTALKKQGKLDEAVVSYNKALSFKPDYADAYYNMGIVLKDQGKLKEAIEAYNKALSVKPDYANVYYNMGIVLQKQIKPQKAIEAYSKALAIKPDHADAYYNLGNAHKDQGNLEEAIEAYKSVLSIKPNYADAYNNMGTALQLQNKPKAAIESYNKALAIKLDYVDVYNNIGTAFKDQGKLEEAIVFYNKALFYKPDYSEAFYGMGTVLQLQNKPQEAIESYNKALAINPDNANARTQKLHQQAQICNWDGIAEDVSLIPELGTSKNYVPPFGLLTLEDAPDRHLIRSKLYAKANYPQKTLSTKARPSKRPKRLRIGYFSADFHEHPVAYLIAKVLKLHNRHQFEVFGYSLHGSNSCEMRRRLEKSFDSFRDVESMSDRDIALQARQDEIDIAVDLNGYTQNARTGIFAYRAAPIQINYLGFPGTMGSNFMDYIVADRFIIPVENQKYFSEQQLYLPNTYLPTDDSRKLSKKKITRSEMRLPDNAFVFCCFNNNYKISPTEFDIWMRLLTKVENSVLWLRKSNQFANANIKNEAQKRNVDPSRLIFADKMPMDEHLARQRLADLFVDTFTYNAHTTASEALWVGLPVVTKIGQGFSARVAGSLLKAVGLPELVTETDQDYEMLILELATNPTKLAKIKEKLATNRLTQALFNTELYTKHLENGFHQAYQNYLDGNPPKTIIVSK
jgi:protein O-GlcNAc transferase